MFSFTSMGGKVDDSINKKGRGPYVFHLHGQTYHSMGSLLPKEGAPPKFTQLYIYDTEKEVENRAKALRDIIKQVKDVLETLSDLVKTFRRARDRYSEDSEQNIQIKLVAKRGTDGRIYNIPTANEVAGLIVGDFDTCVEQRDIVIEKHREGLERINIFHPLYLPLPYPLLMPCGQDGYHLEIPHRKNLDNASRQFLVDGYTMVETERLYFHCAKPSKLRYMEAHNLSATDCLDVMSRVFKMKLDQLMKDLKDLFLYTVEFQKRGLPHVHICLFLHMDEKVPSVDQINKYILAEIPDKNKDPDLYKLVTDFMMHGPCVDSEGYPVYRRRDNGRHVEKSKSHLHNGYVIPYNAALLKRYQCHINVQWCNQTRSIKYLFKYINKGPDRVSAQLCEIVTNDEGQHVKKPIDKKKAFYDCIYLSACEAAWRIFGFETHYRTPSVERLSFHLPGNQTVLYDENSDLETIMHKPSVGQIMFEGWMKMNELYPKARELTHAEFPTKYVWNAPKRIGGLGSKDELTWTFHRICSYIISSIGYSKRDIEVGAVSSEKKSTEKNWFNLRCDSVDTLNVTYAIDKSIFSPEFINGLKFFDVPNHRLELKVGILVMLLRNIDQPNGLCNGTRLQVYPTHLRTKGVGVAAVIGWIGGMVWLSLGDKPGGGHKILPMSFYAFKFIMSRVCALLLPTETLGRELEDNNDSK
ncbi:uncharacterized protein Tco_0351851 [Tanacetum coccineum]